MSFRKALFLALLVGALSLSMLWRLTERGLPYLYLEDEAHHFNRSVEMAQSGDLNPHYFHKPSLHFYLRLPFLWASNELNQVRTRDPYGLAGYAFTTSHPSVVIRARLVSLLLNALLISLTSLLAWRLGLSARAQILAALLVLCSTEVTKNSTVVGVDTLMAAISLLTVFLATGRNVLLSALTAGLAVSSKYNAAPIALIPLLALFLSSRLSIKSMAKAIALAAAGFFLASPFILIEFKIFITQVLFEVQHYQQGHEGQMAEPGLEQLVFYIKWLISDGVGIFAALLSIFGLVVLARRDYKETLVAFSFPILFALLMIAQRTNFTRNMVVVVPFVAIAAAASLPLNRVLAPLISILILVQPYLLTSKWVTSAMQHPDSRRDLEREIQNLSQDGLDVAVSGKLLMPIGVFSLRGVDAFNPKNKTKEQLFLEGFDVVISGPIEPQRVVDNPKFEKSEFKANSQIQAPILEISPAEYNSGEGHLWINSRLIKLKITPTPARGSTIKLLVMSPWPDQSIKIGDSAPIALNTPGTPEELAWVSDGGEFVLVSISEVHSPHSRGISADSRRLGIAVKSLLID